MMKDLEECALYVNGEVLGENITVRGVAGLSHTMAGYLTFVDDRERIPEALASSASALIIPLDIKECARPAIRVRNPRLAFAQLLELFSGSGDRKKGIHEAAWVGHHVTFDEDVYVGSHAVIEDNVCIGKRVQIFPLAYIGPGVTIGDDSIIYPHAALMKGTEVGKRVIIHCGAVIGDDGFGYAKDGNLQVKIPQVGKVVIADDVEIGANTTIDRATVDVTSIGRGTKIDNLVQIGHNCHFGEDCIMVSQAGMAGSVTVGDRVIIAAQAGIRDHTEIGSDATIAGRAGVTKSVASGKLVSGYPARDHREELKIEALIRHLPQLQERVKALEKMVQALEKKAQTQ